MTACPQRKSAPSARTGTGPMTHRIFFGAGGEAFLRGFLRKTACKPWCFCGESVVNCVVNVAFRHHVFPLRKISTFWNYFFQLARFGLAGLPLGLLRKSKTVGPEIKSTVNRDRFVRSFLAGPSHPDATEVSATRAMFGRNKQ